MPSVEVIIAKVIDDSSPVWVECELTDSYGKVHVFREKLPIVDNGDQSIKEGLPRTGAIRCMVLEDKPNSVVIDTELPDGVESVTGTSRFSVSPHKVDRT